MIDIYLGEKLSTVPMVLGWGGSDARPNLEPKLGSWARFLCSAVPGNMAELEPWYHQALPTSSLC